MHILYPFILLVIIILPVTLQAQQIRAAYQFGSGKAWSAAVELPSYTILDLGKELLPLAVNDSGTVLLQSADNKLIRWTWGKSEILMENFIDPSQAFLNEDNTIVATGSSNATIPEITYWIKGQTTGVQLAWGTQLIADPYYARLYALNDSNQLALHAEAIDNLLFLPPETIQIETNLIPLEGGAWIELAMYEYFNDVNFTLTQGGRLFEIQSLNNYGDAVGLVYEDQATSSAWEPDLIYTYQSQYFTVNGSTALDFEPLRINDNRTILGRTLGPLYDMLILDQFGERYIGGVLDDDEAARIRMSNPVDGFEEIIIGRNYWKRMNERNLLGQPTGNPSPDFWQGTLLDIIDNPGSWNNLEATSISANGRIAGTGNLYNPQSATVEEHAFLLVSPALIPDWNRDGKINPFDQQYTGRHEPWRLWINDDDDVGDLATSSDDDKPGSNTPDWANPGIDGLRDVVDFHPVHIDLQKILKTIGDLSKVDILIRQDDEALNLVYSNLHPEEVRLIHSNPMDNGFGPTFTNPLDSAETQAVTSSGVILPMAFLENIRSENRGILLLEGTKATTEPLVMELHHEGSKILTSTLPLSISGVEAMIRVINLRNADSKFANVDPGPWATRTEDPPNLPDAFFESLTYPLRTFIHVHGYNWTGHEIPAAHSEIFKRFFQAGSNARFVGVTWRGDEGMSELTGNSFEYNENVINALITAHYFPDALADFTGPHTSLFAHSLGNMVGSSAIFDQGLAVGNFFMVNAAVPEASYLGETSNRRHMVHPAWKDEGAAGVDYAEHLLSPNWYRLFPPDDNRSFLKWKSRFAGIENTTNCINYYSTGEEVLRTGSGDIPSILGDALNTELVWVYNEMVKGTQTFTANLISDVHGGWGFNRHYMDWVDPGGAAHPPPGSWVEISPAEADLIDPKELIAEPFFHKFSSGDGTFPAWHDGSWLYGDTHTANLYLPPVPFAGANPDLIKNHSKIIAEAIPAHSAPAGSNPLPLFTLLNNVDMDFVMRNALHWPVRGDPDKRDRWLHGDYLYPALSYVFKFYLHCVQSTNKLP